MDGEKPAPIAPTANPSNCPTCGGSSSSSARTTVGQSIILIGNVTASFPSMSVEKEFAQLLGRKDFKGFTDRQTMHSVLEKRENRYFARRMCFLHTPYGEGTSPAYVLVPEDPEDIVLLVDTLKRPLSTSEFDVIHGRIVGIAPPALCNAQQLPIVSFSQLHSFPLHTFIQEILADRGISKESETACEELFHRTMRSASNAIGPTIGLSYAALNYPGLYKLAAEKFAENFSLAKVSVTPARRRPDCAAIRLKFVKRDTGFAETFCFLVNYAGPFPYLEELLHPCLDIDVSEGS